MLKLAEEGLKKLEAGLIKRRCHRPIKASLRKITQVSHVRMWVWLKNRTLGVTLGIQ